MKKLLLSIAVMTFCNHSNYGKNSIKSDGKHHSREQQVKEDKISGRAFLSSYLSRGTFWYGPVTAHSKSAIQAELTYDKLGWARIIWLPKSQKQKYFIESKIKRVNYKWIKHYALARESRRNFDLWALYVPAKYNGDQPDLEDTSFFPEVFPATAELLKLVNEKWIYVKTITIPRSHNLFDALPSPR